MELIKVPMRLKYYMVDIDKIVDAGKIKWDEDWWHGWLETMMKSDDMGTIIWFLVAETTDIFESEKKAK